MNGADAVVSLICDVQIILSVDPESVVRHGRLCRQAPIAGESSDQRVGRVSRYRSPNSGGGVDALDDVVIAAADKYVARSVGHNFQRVPHATLQGRAAVIAKTGLTGAHVGTDFPRGGIDFANLVVVLV